MTVVTLDTASVEAIVGQLTDRLLEPVSVRVARLLGDQGAATPPRLVTAAEVAQRFGMSPETVRAKAELFGAVRMGDGKRPRLRFDLERVAEVLSCQSTKRSPSPITPAPTDVRSRRRRTAGEPSVQLIPEPRRVA